MLKLVESPEKWAKKYNLEIKEVECAKCGKKMMRDIPFALKGYRGLKTAEHECGKMFIRSVAVPVNGALDKIRSILFGE